MLWKRLLRSGKRNRRSLRKNAIRPEPLEVRLMLSGVQPFVVSTTLDVVDPDDNLTSLREAIANANAEPGVQEITFDLPTGFVLQLAAGQLAITDSVRIVGLGRVELTIDAGGLSRIFDVASDKSLSLEALTLTGGSAEIGAAIRGNDRAFISLTDGALVNNTASNAGGGIHTLGSVTIVDSILHGNSAVNEGGAVLISYSTTTQTRTLNISDSHVEGNTAIYGGAFHMAYGGFINSTQTDYVNNAALSTATLSGGLGGAMYMVGSGFFGGAAAITIDGGRFEGNRANGGGVISSTRAGLQIQDSAFVGNHSLQTFPGYGGLGGAINHNGLYMWVGSFSINRSTFENNFAANGGGALRVGGSLGPIRNSTFSGNSSSSGGAISATEPSGLTLDHVTITNNTATGFWGGAGVSWSAATVHNSIIAGNHWTTTGGGGRDVTGSFAAGSSYNVVGHQNYGTLLVNGVNGNQVGVTDPGLAPLADNGGLTRTHALLPSSPAINAGNPASTLLTDQRGVSRQGIPDIGAFEFESPFVVTTTQDVVDPDDGVISLREAVTNANNAAGFNQIEFALPSGSVVTLTAGQLSIIDETTIVGLGRDELTIDAGGLSRIFDVSASQILTIEDLTLTGGSAEDGGAIRGGLNSRIILQDTRLADNVATRHGGGIYTIGTVEVLGSQLIDNAASSDGGAIHRAGTSGSRNVIIRESELIGNSSGHRGGAVFLHDSGLNIYDSVFESNASQQAGGAISTGGGTAYTGFYVSGTAFLNNSARETGGAINMVNHSYFTVLDSLFEGNQVSDSLRPGWYSSFGGAIHISKGWFGESAFVGTTINRTTFVSNSALGPSGSGGAISVRGGETTILNSTISRNQALSGGGIRVFSGSISGIGTTLGLDHVTITDNTATGLGAGGGIYSGDATTSHNSIISGNMATVLGGAWN